MQLQITSYLLYLLPIALVTGPFLADLFLTLIGLSFLIILLKEKCWNFFNHFIIKILIIFYIYILIRSLLSSNPMLSLEGSLFYIRYIFFSLGVAYIVLHNKNFFNYFGNFLFLTIALVTIDAIIQYWFGFNMLLYERPGEQLTGFFVDEKILGSYLARLMPLCFAFIIIKNKKSYLFLFLFILILSDVVIYLSGERSAFFYLLASTFIIVITTKKWKAFRLATFILSIVLIILISYFNSDIRERMVDLTVSQIGISEGIVKGIAKGDVKAFSEHHQSHYSSSFKMFFDNPLFGHGPKMFRYLCKFDKYNPFLNKKSSLGKDACSTHPHNTYVQLLAETGVVGTSMIAFIFLMIVYMLIKQFYYIYFFRKIYLSDFHICLITCGFVSLFPFTPSGSFFNNWLSVIYFLPLGIFIANNISKQV